MLATDPIDLNSPPETFESELLDLADTDPIAVVVSAIGSFSCCDVWLSGPDPIVGRFDLVIYGRVGDVRMQLGTIKSDTYTMFADASRSGALVMSIRGRPCTAFEVDAVPGVSTTGIKVFLVAWHADVAPALIRGDVPVQKVSQGDPGDALARWPVYLSDGTSAQGVVAKPVFARLSDGSAAQGVVGAPLFTRLSDGAAAQGTVTKPLYVQLSDGAAVLGTPTNPVATRRSRDGAKTWGALSTVITTGTAAATTNSIGYLWKAGGASRVEIVKIIVGFVGLSTSGSVAIRGCHITAENGTPGGSLVTPKPFDRADTGPAATFRSGATGAPTRDLDLLAVMAAGSQSGNSVFTPEDFGEALVLRPSVNEGFEIRTLTNSVLSTGMLVVATFHWIEI